jgi:hypothetical protein
MHPSLYRTGSIDVGTNCVAEALAAVAGVIVLRAEKSQESVGGDEVPAAHPDNGDGSLRAGGGDLAAPIARTHGCTHPVGLTEALLGSGGPPEAPQTLD